MKDEDARHFARREQLTLLLNPHAGEAPPADGEAVELVEPSAWHVIVLMLSMAHTLDTLPGQPGGRLEQARLRAMSLLQAGGESEADARELLDGAEQAIRSAEPQAPQSQQAPQEPPGGADAPHSSDATDVHDAPEAPDPSVCLAWLALLEEEVEYLQLLMRE